MKSKCIVCGDEFTAERYGRKFCDKPACRQKFNRREHALDRAAESIRENVKALRSAIDDENFRMLGEKLLRQVEKDLAAQLDEIAPNRHLQPKVEFRVERAKRIEVGREYWAVPPVEGDLLHVMVKTRYGVQWYECELISAPGWNKPRCILPSNTVFIEVEERGAEKPSAPTPIPASQDEDEVELDEGDFEDEEELEEEYD